MPKPFKNRPKNDANMKLIFSFFFEKGVHEKTIFFEKGEIVLTVAGCSRMRVGEGSHKKIKY